MKKVKNTAEELVQAFRSEIYKGVITTADMNFAREAARDNKAAQCALISVLLVIQVCPAGSDTCFWIQVKDYLTKTYPVL